MAIRVAHIGTGNVGRLALSELIANPAFELTGLVVSTDEKVGKDAGELAGLDVTTGHQGHQGPRRRPGSRTRVRGLLRDG